MSTDHLDWCHQCDQPVLDWAEFVAHANAGHAITRGRCPGACQFPA